MRHAPLTARQRISSVLAISMLTLLAALPATAIPYEGDGGSTGSTQAEPLVQTVTTGVSPAVVVAIVVAGLLATAAAYVAGVSHERRLTMRHA